MNLPIKIHANITRNPTKRPVFACSFSFIYAIIKRTEKRDMFEFISDLDEYFSKEYAGYDKLSVLPGYKMPMMQATKVDEFGRTISYTLPPDTMALSKQENKAQLLVALKERMVDKTFSFSFSILSFFGRVKQFFSKYGLAKNLKKMMGKYGVKDEDVLAQINIAPEIWKGIKKGAFLPTKNLILTLALTAQMSYDDTLTLLSLCDYYFDDTIVKDVVISYLLSRRVYNPSMVQAALEEYKVTNLFFKA